MSIELGEEGDFDKWEVELFTVPFNHLPEAHQYAGKLDLERQLSEAAFLESANKNYFDRSGNSQPTE